MKMVQRSAKMMETRYGLTQSLATLFHHSGSDKDVENGLGTGNMSESLDHSFLLMSLLRDGI